MCASSLQTPHLRLIYLQPHLRPGYIRRQAGTICGNDSVSVICSNIHVSPASAACLCDHASKNKAALKVDCRMYLICSFIKYIFLFCSLFYGQMGTNTKRTASACCPQQVLVIVYSMLDRSKERRSAASVIAVDTLHAFVLFLRMQAE